MTTGERIRAARLNAGLTQKKLSELTGIAEPTIRKYESNRLKPKKETLDRIAHPLGIFWLDLVGDDPSIIWPENDLEHAWDDWLHSNGIYFVSWELNGIPGLLVLFRDWQKSTYESFFLTQEQAERLPNDSIAIIKAMIREIGQHNIQNAPETPSEAPSGPTDTE